MYSNYLEQSSLYSISRDNLHQRVDYRIQHVDLHNKNGYSGKPIHI
jgi:hypothetical protein